MPTICTIPACSCPAPWRSSLPTLIWKSARPEIGSLALIAEDFGPQVAFMVARELVVYMKRPGGQDQFPEPPKFQVASTSRFADLAVWILRSLDGNPSVDVLAERVNLCPRRFSRRFRAEFKDSPAAFVQRLRLDESRKRLSSSGCSVESAANSVGFNDPDGFRRAFVQHYGVPPHHYHSRFRTDFAQLTCRPLD